MLFKIDSDAAYLVCPEARSRAEGYHYLGNKDNNLFNGPIYVLAKIIKNVMVLAAEAEVAGLFMNAQQAVPMQLTLEDMGHKQPPTLLQTDNKTTQGMLSGVYKQKRSKSNDMNFHWIRCRIRQKQFEAKWAPGKNNLANAPTKHHQPAHHKRMRPINLCVEGKSPSTLKGCISIRTQTTKLPVTQATKLPVTQTQSYTIMATAALTSLLKSYTHRISAIVNRLNAKIHS